MAAFALPAFFAPARAEPVIGQFELKTLESARGSLEFQSQNAWSWSEPARRIASGPDGFEFDENAVIRERYALELEMGFARTLKMRVGIEFEKERLDDPATIAQANDFGDLSLTEVGAEVIAVLKPRDGDDIGFGIVAEIEGAVDQQEANNFTLGSIIEFQSGRWFAAAVPMLVYVFGAETEAGETADDKLDLAYAAQLMYMPSEAWSFGLEGYGTIERLGSTGRPSSSAQRFGDFNQHRVGPVFYYTHHFAGSADRQSMVSGAGGPSSGDEPESASLTIGLGLLEGLNENTADHTLKLSIEIGF